MIYIFIIFVTFSLSGMQEDPSKPKDSVCRLAHVPADVLNQTLLPFIISLESDKEFVVRAKKNYASQKKRRALTSFRTRHGSIAIEVSSSNQGGLSLIPNEGEKVSLCESRRGNDHFQININHDHSKLFFVYMVPIRVCGDYFNYSKQVFYDLDSKKMEFLNGRHCGGGYIIESCISGSGNYMAHLSIKGRPKLYVCNSKNQCHKYYSPDNFSLSNPSYLAFNKQETKVVVIDESGKYVILPVPETIQITEDVQKSKITMKEYLQRKGVCKDLR